MKRKIITLLMSIPGMLAVIFSFALYTFSNAYDNEVVKMIVENRDILPQFDSDLELYIQIAVIQEYKALILVLGIVWIIAVLIISNIMKGNGEYGKQ